MVPRKKSLCILLNSGVFCLLDSRIVSCEYRIFIRPAIFLSKIGPVISFLEAKLEVFRELEIQCSHSEELVLYILVIKLILKEIDILMLGIRSIIVVLDVFSRA
jgi:hypothetical protein